MCKGVIHSPFFSLPCATNTTKEGSAQKKSSNRFCHHWRMVPAVITLATTIIAIVCAFIWKYPSLSLAFVPGVGASVYLISLAHDVMHLKTFSKNNKELEHHVEVFERDLQELEKEREEFAKENLELKQNVTRLEATSAQLQENNEALQVTQKDLSASAVTFKSENRILVHENKKLKKTTKELEQLKETLVNKASMHVERLEVVQNSLSDIQIAALENHRTFSEVVTLLDNAVKNFLNAEGSFEATGSEIEKKMKMQYDLELGIVVRFEKTFKEISNWMNNEYIKQQIDTQKLLTQQVVALEKQIALNEGQLQERAKQQKELAQLNEGFQMELTRLINVIETAGRMTDSLSNVSGDLSTFKKQITAVADLARNVMKFG
jgi:hypothetical protein